jgi:D-alanyl-D-alanine carboxypeptidase
MLSTSELRTVWAPACDSSDMRTIDFGTAGARITVRRATVPAFRVLAAVMESYNYRIRPADTGAYNCRQITGGSGYSLHAYGIAADVNWQTNPYASRLITDMPWQMIRAIESIRTVDGHQVFGWGGRYSGSKDAMHFEIVVTPAQLARGIRGGVDMPLSDADKNAIREIVQNNREALQDTVQNQADRLKAEIEQEARATRRALIDYDEAVVAVTNPAIKAAVRAKLQPATLAVLNVVD